MDVPESVLIVGAHPDDCEFGAGGIAYQWARKGCVVHFVVVTDGSKGSAGCDECPEELVTIRRSEQFEASRLLGVTDCHFLGFCDGELKNDHALLTELVRVIRVLRPQVVFTHTPEHLDHRRFRGQEGASVNHRDHRVVGSAVLDAIYPNACNPNSFQELELSCHRVEQVFLWGSRFPNTRLECQEGIRRKAQALACHRSQFGEDVDWGALIEAWGTAEEFERIETQ
jgi:LmbE family N-acetylglucosaminyl deacetylase